MRLFQSERNRDNPPTLWELTITVCFFPAGQQNLIDPRTAAGRGVRELPLALKHYKRKLQVMDDEEGRCLFKCLVLGMDDVWKKEGGAEKSQMYKSPATVLRKAKELQETLMLDVDVSDCYWSDIDRFVEVYTAWRVCVVSPSGGLANKGIWKGEDFVLPESEKDYGRSIFLCYFDNHFYRIPNSRFSQFAAKSSKDYSHCKRCRACLAYCREKKFDNHNCEGRFHCKRCDTWMDSNDEKHSHTADINTDKWKCANCSIKCGSEGCQDKHFRQCKEKNSEEHCHRCKQAYTAEDYLDDGTLHHEGNPLRCKPYKCKNNACRELFFTLEELQQHRDYIAPLKRYPKRRRDADEVDDENDSLACHFAWDIETISYDKTIMIGSPQHQKVVKEQRVHLIIACSLGGTFSLFQTIYSNSKAP